ncbi:DUF6470 family protein [Paenibacillus sp. 481]|uniref:DUF6470 family protein n=1 Tax=Paenibacillus sp. 481 TaxID=2835869 RepID=UPI001E3C2F79|nr:DUF6470 family protein [Paenibacillus sp. 481]UHA75709.1 hypothetical protein KIK04_12365 [Paenibacillus sp. 481]
MNMPRIQIQQQFSQIGLQRELGKHSIEQPRAELNMHQEQVKVELSRTDGKLDIDARKAWSALGKAKFEETTDRIAQQSLQISMQNIASLAQEGDRMMAFHKKENAFAEIAKQRMFKQFPIDIVGEAKYDNVDVTYTAGSLQTNWKSGRVELNVQTKKPIIDYYPGKVNPYLIRQNFIFMSATGQQLDAIV